jgi:hypothetical protein
LEDRDTPAVYLWSPIDGLYSTTAVNWLKGVGPTYTRYTVYEHPPRAGDDVYFSGHISNADCIIPPWGGQQPQPGGPPVPPPPPPAHAGDTFNSIRTVENYTGSVEVGRDLQVNILPWGRGTSPRRTTTT